MTAEAITHFERWIDCAIGGSGIPSGSGSLGWLCGSGPVAGSEAGCTQMAPGQTSPADTINQSINQSVSQSVIF